MTRNKEWKLQKGKKKRTTEVDVTLLTILVNRKKKKKKTRIWEAGVITRTHSRKPESYLFTEDRLTGFWAQFRGHLKKKKKKKKIDARAAQHHYIICQALYLSNQEGTATVTENLNDTFIYK